MPDKRNVTENDIIMEMIRFYNNNTKRKDQTGNERDVKSDGNKKKLQKL